MPIIIKPQDIDEAIENLRYKNETTLKSRLLRAVRQYYVDDASSESLQAIDTEELVRTVWETGDNSDLLKTKRKNFSSLKSSVNSDLKKLYAEGKNPQGIVIGHDNTFTISDEAKDRALTGIMDVFKEKGIDTQSKVSDILSALSDILSSTMSRPDIENTKEEIDRLKSVLGGISGKLGLSVEDILHRAAQADGGGPAPDEGPASTAAPFQGKDLSGYVHGELSVIDKGLQGLALEAVKAASDATEAQVKESVRTAFAEMIQVLKEAGTDATGKARRIMAAVEGMLACAIDASRDDLSGEQAGKLKQIFHEMTAGAGEAQIAADRTATPGEQAGGKLQSDVNAILADPKMSAGDKISHIMDAVNEMIGAALAGAGEGLSDEDRAHIRSMLDNLTGNLNTLAQDSLAGFEIIEENIEESDTGGAEIVEEIVEDEPPPAAEIEEIVEDEAAAPVDEMAEIVEEVAADIVTEDTGAEAAAETAEMLEEVSEEVLVTAEGLEELADELELAAAANALLLEEIAESDTGELEQADLPPAEAVEIDAAAESTEMIEDIAEDQVEWTTEEAAVTGDEAVEMLEEFIEETVDEPEALPDDTSAGQESSELIEVEDQVPEDVEEIPEETPESDAPVPAVQEAGKESSGPEVVAADKNIDADLREKTELLKRLAEAAGALEAIGPDLNSSIYTEEEIRGKAKFLSEEFDRYLSIRDRYYNAHILIKSGDYLVGGAHLAKSVLPEQIVTLPDFFIGKFPVTNALFEIFVEQTGYITTAEKYGFGLVYFPRMQRSRDPITGVERFSLHNSAYSKKVQGACWHRPFGPGSSLYVKRTHPVVQVSWEDARAFAIWTGKRLPTEIEWEAAARTPRGNTFPWGNEWQEDACNIEKSLYGDTTPVDQYVKFANAFEVADTLGNVLEWTNDAIGDEETSDTCIVKGASWISHSEISLTDRHYIERSVSSNILGFRCVAI